MAVDLPRWVLYPKRPSWVDDPMMKRLLLWTVDPTSGRGWAYGVSQKMAVPYVAVCRMADDRLKRTR